MVISVQNLETYQMYYFMVGLVIAVINLRPFFAEFRKNPKYGMYLDQFIHIKIIISVFALALSTVFWPVVGAELLGNLIGKRIYESRKKRGLTK